MYTTKEDLDLDEAINELNKAYTVLEITLRKVIFPLRAAGILLLMLLPLKSFAQEQISPADYNLDFVIEENQVKGIRVYPGFKNFYNGNSWQEIDVTPLETKNSIIVENAPYTLKLPIYLGDSPIIFENDSLYNPKKRTIERKTSLTVEKNFLNVNSVKGLLLKDSVIYYNAFPRYQADLVIKLRPDGIEQLIQLNQQVPKLEQGKDAKFCFDETRKGNSQKEVVTLQRKVRDSSIPPKIKEINFVKGCKVIPWDFLSVANFPVYADDIDTINVLADANQGADGTPWSTVISQSTASNADNAPINAYIYGNTGYTNSLYWVNFDLASLPQVNKVNSATLNVYVDLLYNSGSRGAAIFGPTSPASNTSFATTDYPNRGTTQYSVTKTTWSTASYNSINLNSTATGALTTLINSNSLFKIALRHSDDYTATTPTNLNGIRILASGSSTNKPYLEITYEPYSGGGSGGSGSTTCTTQSGCNLSFTGSLLITETFCNQTELVYNASGAIVGENCIQWDSEIKVPFIKFVVDNGYQTILNSAFAIFLLILIYKLVKIPVKFAYNLLRKI